MTWWPMHSWHPVAVHLPLVGIVLAVILDLASTQRRNDQWRHAASILWVLGLLGAVIAISTGLIAYNRVDHSDLAHSAMNWHRNLAIATSLSLMGGAIWRWRQPYSRGAAGFAFAAMLALTGVGYLGGDLVYRHGIGISNDMIEQIAHERGGHAHDSPDARDTSTVAPDHHHE